MALHMNTPYVYIVRNNSTQLKYIGVRYSKNCDPNDFWVKYFTSSKLIHELVKIYGVEDFDYRIIKRFDSAYDALSYERKLLDCAVPRFDYLNIHRNFVQNTEQEFLDNENKMRMIRTFYGKLQYIRKTGFHAVSPEQFSKNAAIGGRVAAEKNRTMNRAIFNEEFRKRQHKTLREKELSSFYNSMQHIESSRKGGKNGAFSKNYYENAGIDISLLSAAQSSRGKKGGKKNMGSIYYNDGEKEFKFFPSENESFEKFLMNNEKFKRGRLTTSSKGKIWVNDGERNYLKFDDYDKNLYTKGKIKNKK